MGQSRKSASVLVRRVVSRFEDVVCESPKFGGVYGSSLDSPHVVAELLRRLICQEPVEVLVALLLNGKHRIIGVAEVSRGTLTSSLVHPREVYGPAVRMGSAAVLVAHNHPSGDPEPSREDIEVTKRLKEAGVMLGIPLLDHVIIGEGERFVSLHERQAF